MNLGWSQIPRVEDKSDPKNNFVQVSVILPFEYASDTGGQMSKPFFPSDYWNNIGDRDKSEIGSRQDLNQCTPGTDKSKPSGKSARQ